MGWSFFMWYTQCQSALGSWERTLNEWFRILMGKYFVTCNVFSLKYLCLIPWSIYWFIPSTGLMEIMVIHWWFSFITGCNENSAKILKLQKAHWVNHVIIGDVKMVY